jgi:hypothetical protein
MVAEVQALLDARRAHRRRIHDMEEIVQWITCR